MGGIIKIDVHGKNIEETKRATNIQIYAAKKDICRIRVTHGYDGDTRVRNMLQGGCDYDKEPAAKRIEMGDNQSITEPVFREF